MGLFGKKGIMKSSEEEIFFVLFLLYFGANCC